MLRLLIKRHEDYYFIVHPKSAYNTTGKHELHSLESEKPILVGYWKICRGLIIAKITDTFLY